MLRIRTLLSVVLAVAWITAAAPLMAAEYTDQQKHCAQEFDQCVQYCNDTYKDDTSKRVACVPTCSGHYAACDAGAAYEAAKPWIKDKADQTKRFFDDLMKKYGGGEPAPDPQKKTKKNSI